MTGVNGASGQVVVFPNEWITAADTFFPIIADPDVPVECRLSLFVPLGFSLEGFAYLLATGPALFISLVLILNALSLGLHLLFGAKFYGVDSSVRRAAPTDVVVLRYEPLVTNFALTAGWFTHCDHPTA